MDSLVRQHFRSELRKIDWSFADASHNGEYAAVHWYPARFIPEIPGTLIGYFSNENDLVLDPFCGSGTTLTEAQRLRRRSVGIDLNPVATMIAAARIDTSGPESLALAQTELERNLIEEGSSLDVSAYSREAFDLGHAASVMALDSKVEIPIAELCLWYHPKTLAQLGLITRLLWNWDLDSGFRAICNAAFSAVLRRMSSQDHHWGYVCDNMKPKTLTYKDATEAFTGKLNEFLTLRKTYLSLCDADWTSLPGNKPTITTGDALDELPNIKSESVDFVLTSPPYLNVTDYLNSQRLSFLWLARHDREKLRPVEIGSRAKRFKPNPSELYMADMTTIVTEIARILKNGRFFALVIGESKSHPEYIEELVAVCETQNLHLIDSLQRKIPMKRSLAPSLSDERIFILQKEKKDDSVI